MKPLHTRYHNLGSWKRVRGAEESETRIVFRSSTVVIQAAILFVLCIAAAGLLAVKLPPQVEMRNIAIGIVAATGILTPAAMVAYAVRRAKRGPLLTYHASKDLLTVAEPALEIAQAYQRVSFSRERFHDGEYRFEFNLVVDGERKKFLSSSTDAFSSISRHLGEMGFRVSEHKIKL